MDVLHVLNHSWVVRQGVVETVVHMVCFLSLIELWRHIFKFSLLRLSSYFSVFLQLLSLGLLFSWSLLVFLGIGLNFLMSFNEILHLSWVLVTCNLGVLVVENTVVFVEFGAFLF